MSLVKQHKPETSIHGIPLKEQIYQAIKADNLAVVMNIQRNFGIDPTEELISKNESWNCLHCSCFYNAPTVFKYFLKLVYSLYKEDYTNKINQKTIEGWSPLMMSAIYISEGCADDLLKFGGVRLYDVDNNGLKASDLAKRFKNETLFKKLMELEDSINRQVSSDVISDYETPFFEKYISIKSEVNSQEVPSCHNVLKESTRNNSSCNEEVLFKNGRRLPCIVCTGKRGWLKYTDCCGSPIHPLCVKNLKECSNCHNVNVNLVDSVIYPERAFTIEEQVNKSS